jgi:hypothetical protein
MRLTARLTRRVITTTALASAAVLLPVMALASSAGTSAPQTTAAAVHRCYVGQLTAWLAYPPNGAAGSYTYQLEISNVSAHKCTLYGYPGVSAVKANGAQLGSAGGRLAGYPKPVVTLAPYQTSHVQLQITDVYVFTPSACHLVTAAALKVYPPGDYAAITVPLSFKACAKKGPVYLHVTPAFPNAGIPGYPHD